MATIQERLDKMRQDNLGLPSAAPASGQSSITQRLDAMKQDTQRQRQTQTEPFRGYDPSSRFSFLNKDENAVAFPGAKDRYMASDVADAESWLKTQSDKMAGTRSELERRESSWGDIRIAPPAATEEYTAAANRRNFLGLGKDTGKSYLDLAREYSTDQADFRANYDVYQNILRQIEDNADDYEAQAGALEADAGKKRQTAQSMQRMIDDGLISEEQAAMMGYPEQIAALLKEADELDAQARPYRETGALIPGLRFQRKYGDLYGAEDFAEKSGYEEELTEEGPAANDLTRKWAFPLYEIVNGNAEAKDAYTARRMSLYGGGLNPIGALWGGVADNAGEAQDMTEDEVALFNYIYHTQGQEAAQAFYDEIKGDLNARRRLREQSEWGEYAKEKPFESSLFSIVESPLRGLSYLGQIADLADDGKIDANAGYNRFTTVPGDIRAAISKEIEDSGKWGKAGSFLYQTGMSMGDFLMSLAASGGNEAFSLAIMGTGAAADTVITAKERGLSDKQAFALGTIAGAAEVITEKVSIETLLNKTALTENALGYFLKNVLAEGSEEVGSDLINLLADTLISKDKSEWQTAMRKLREENPDMSEKDAFWRVFLDQAQQMGVDFLGGAISGGVMAGGSIAVNAAADYSAAAPTRRANSAISDAYAAMQEYGPFSPEARAAAEKAETRLRKTGNAWIGDTFITDQPEAQEDDVLADLPELKPGDPITGRMIRSVAADDALLRALGIESEGKSKSAVRSEVRTALEMLRDSGAVAPDGAVRTETGSETATDKAALKRDFLPTAGARDMLRDMVTESGIGTNGARVLETMYQGERATDYFGGFAAAYNAGVEGNALETVQTALSQKLTPEQRQAAWEAGQMDAVLAEAAKAKNAPAAQRSAAGASSREGTREAGARSTFDVTGGQNNVEQIRTAEGNDVSDGGGERAAGLRAGEQNGRLEGSARKAAAGEVRTAAQRHALVRDLRLQPADPVNDFKIPNAVNTGETYVLPEDQIDAPLRKIREDNRRSGVETVFILGSIPFRKTNGAIKRARGTYVPATNTVYVQVDNLSATPEQIAEHELWHARYQNMPQQDRLLEERIGERYSPEEFEKVLDRYISALAGVIDLHEGMTDAEYEAALGQIKNELFADAVSGLNGFGAGATQFTETAQQFRDEFWGANKQTAEATEKTTGPPAQFSFTDEDVQNVQSIGRKNINDLTEDELRRIEGFAAKAWADMGVKSPFFRAWFGDWRVNDASPVSAVDVLPGKAYKAGKNVNRDTERSISWGNDLKQETFAHLRSNGIALSVLGNIDKLIEEAKLFDTSTSDRSSKTKLPGTAFMHSFYVLVNDGNSVSLLKLYVEEAVSKSGEDFSRAYDLKDIKRVATSAKGVLPGNGGLTQANLATINSVADLFAAVKAYDPDFRPQEPSKIVNADGTPKVMYRGGSERIAVFDRKKSSPSNLYGRGFYFTDDETRAKQYGDARPYYLDAKNPLRPGQHSITRQQMRAFLDAVAENEDDYDFWNYGQRATVDSVLRDLYGKGDFEMLQDVSATAIGDLVAAVELFNSVNGTEYDGIDLPTETVMFESNKIKSATENAGTFGRENPNVFFSEETDTDELREELRARGNVETRRALADTDRAAFRENEDERRRIRREIRENENRPKEIAAVEQELARLRDKDYQHRLLDEGGADAVLKNAREIVRLEERLKRMRGETAEEKPAKGRKKAAKKTNAPTISVRQLQNDLLRYMSTPEGQKAEMGRFIASFADKVYREGKITQEDVDVLMDRLYSAGVVTVPATEYQRAGRDAVKDGRIYVPESVKAEFGDDWNSFRSKAWGSGVYLVNDSSARGADKWNVELSELFPGIFDSKDADLRGIVEKIVQLAEEGKDQKMSLADYTAMLAGQEYTTEEQLQEGMERHIDWALRTFAEKANLEIKLKDRSDARVQQERAAAWERRQAEQQRKKADREIRELQQKTLKQVQWLEKNRDKAPAVLRPKIDEVLSDLNFYSVHAVNEMRWSSKYKMTFGEIADLIERKTNENSKEHDVNFIPTKELTEIWKRVKLNNSGVRNIGEMDIGDLRQLYNAAAQLRQEVYDRNNLVNDEFNRTVAGVAADSIDELKATAKAQKKGKLAQKADEKWQSYNDAQLTPMNRFEQMAGWRKDSAWYSLAKMLEKGERDQRRFKVEANAMLADFMKQNKKWVQRADGQGKDGIWYEVQFSPVAEWGEMDQPIFGDPVTVWMTPTMKVQMYLESKSEDNLRHMAGGRTFANKELYSRGKRAEAYKQGARTFLMTPEAVKKIVSDLTVEEKALADILERFYNEFSKGEINRVSNALYGYDKAMGRYYAPIYTDSNYNRSEPGVFDVTAEGVGNLKTRKESWTPSLNISAIDAFEKSVDRTAKFVGLAIPVRNVNAVLNWTSKGESVKKVLDDTQGAGTVSWVEDLMTELQGNKDLKHPKADVIMDKALSKYVQSVFGANWAIVAKQFASFPLATAYLGWSNMPKWIPGAAQVDRELVRKYTGELGYRNMGYATPETALMKDNPGLLQSNRVLNFAFGGGAINWMDDFTVRTLWTWAENKVRNETQLRPGTQTQIDAGEDAFYKAVASEFEEAVSRSQPMYDVMHRSQVMRESSGVSRAFTMFKTVPQQEYNMLREAFGEMSVARESGDTAHKREAAAKAGKAVLGIMVGNLMIGTITFLNALWKNKAKKYRDDDGELTPESVMEQFIGQYLRDSAGVFIGGDVAADVIGAILGEHWYSLDAPGLTQVNEILEGVVNAGKTAVRLVQDSSTIADNGGDWGEYIRKHGYMYVKAVEDAVRVLATYKSGLPINNVRAYLLGALSWASPVINVAYEDAVKQADKNGLSGLTGAALEMRIEHLMGKHGIQISDESSETLAKLYEAGEKTAIPTDAPSSVTVNGEDRKLSLTQQQTWDKTWSGTVNGALDELVSSDVFQAADTVTQAKMLDRLYDYATEKAKEALFDDYEPKSSTEKTDAMIAAGVAPAEWAAWKEAVSDEKRDEQIAQTLASDLSDEGLLAAIGNLIGTDMETESGNPTQWAKLNTAIDDGVSKEDAVRMLQDGELDTYIKWRSSDAKVAGISAVVYIAFRGTMNSTQADKDENGKTISGSKKEKVMRYIDSLPLTVRQKDALYYDAGYTESTIDDAPWHGGQEQGLRLPSLGGVEEPTGGLGTLGGSENNTLYRAALGMARDGLLS